MDIKNFPVAVCYPPGAGGSMLAAAMNSIVSNCKFNISDKGHCHNNNVITLPHYVPSNTLTGFENELGAIKILGQNNQHFNVLKGHVRNLVALQSVYPDLWFIKIVFDENNLDEIEFLNQMLMFKVSMRERYKTCYAEVKLDTWPESFEDFLNLHNCNDLFQEQNYHTLKNWFWVESYDTRIRTIELTIQDIFLGIPGEKLSCWYNKETIDKLYVLTKQFQDTNNKLYNNTMSLLKK